MQPAASMTLDAVLRDVKILVENLIEASRSPVSEIPTTQGVYLIYDKSAGKIYVGKGKNLRRRLQADHCGGDEDMSTSTFRRSVSKVYGITAGQPVREWVRTNCSFAFVDVPDADLCLAVEAVAIRLLRLQGCKLLNN
jgi:hypothetical protein